MTRFFYSDDYNKVMKNVDKDEVNQYMVCLQTIRQYLGAIQMIYNIKKLHGLVNIEKCTITTDRLTNVIKLVGKHKERVVKLLYKERLDDKFQPFMSVGQIPIIKGGLWNVSCMKELGCWSHSYFS